jgi:hypothetical protein
MPALDEPTPFIVGEPKAPPTQLTRRMRFSSIRWAKALLPMIQPADQEGEKKPREREVNHRRESTSPAEIRTRESARSTHAPAV